MANGWGGSRSRSGPEPDPNALRRDRADDAATWRTLPPERTGALPEWPLPGQPSDDELEHWTKIWKLPQATIWEEEGTEDDVALYVRSFIEAAAPGATSALRKDVRIMRDDLGLSPGAMLRKRWTVANAAAVPSDGPAPVVKADKPSAPRRGSSRDRVLRAVPPTQS